MHNTIVKLQFSLLRYYFKLLERISPKLAATKAYSYMSRPPPFQTQRL